MMGTPIAAKFALPPVWSPCTWVLMRKRMSPFEMPWTAAWMRSLRGANWSSIMTTPSSPTDSPMLPPRPSR